MASRTGELPGLRDAVTQAGDRPMLQLLRSDCIIKLYREGDSYTLRVAKLRSKSVTLEGLGLTAEQALEALSKEMSAEVGP